MNKELTDKELDQLISLAKRVLWSSPEIRKKLQDQKVNIIPANFYSNIPLISDIKNSFEYTSSNPEIYNSAVFDKKKYVNLLTF